MLYFFNQYIWTPIAVFLASYFLLRFIGKRKVYKTFSSILLVTVIIGTSISESIVTKQLGMATYYSIAVAMVYVVFVHLTLNHKLKHLITTSPIVLVKNGDIDELGLRQSKISVQDLLGELREKGYSKVQDVELAMMEQTGEISVLPKGKARLIEPGDTGDIQLIPRPAEIPIPLIYDGVIVEHNLSYLKKDQQWLKEQLHNYPNFKDITLATYNANGKMFIDVKKKPDLFSKDI